MAKKKSKVTERSKCCNAKVRVAGKTTLHYVCNQCQNPCEVIFVPRKTWTRNPATQIIPNAKCKAPKLTKKEIREILLHEDF